MDLHEIFTKGWQWAYEQIWVAIQITIWIQGLFSVFITIGRYGKWLLMNISAAHTDLPDGGSG